MRRDRQAARHPCGWRYRDAAVVGLRTVAQPGPGRELRGTITLTTSSAVEWTSMLFRTTRSNTRTALRSGRSQRPRSRCCTGRLDRDTESGCHPQGPTLRGQGNEACNCSMPALDRAGGGIHRGDGLDDAVWSALGRWPAGIPSTRSCAAGLMDTSTKSVLRRRSQRSGVATRAEVEPCLRSLCRNRRGRRQDRGARSARTPTMRVLDALAELGEAGRHRTA